MAQTTQVTLSSEFKAYAGMFVDGIPRKVESFTNGEGADIEFGIGLIKHATNDFECILPAGAVATGVFLGVSVRSDHYGINELLAADSDIGIPDDATVGVMREGKIWVRVERAVTADAPVFVRITAQGALTRIGAFAAADDLVTPATTLAVSNARFRSDAAAGELAQLELNGICILS